LTLFLVSCNTDFLEEEKIEQIPEIVDEDFPDKKEGYSKPESHIIKFDSLTPIYREYIKKNSIVREYLGGQISMKIQTSNLEVHCSSENYGNHHYIGIEIKQEYEFRDIEKGNVFQEIWDADELIATIFYVEGDDGEFEPPSYYYDDHFMKGFTARTNISSRTIPEREREKIIRKKDLSKKAFDKFLWMFQFQEAGTELEEFENIQKFYLHPAYIDGRSAPDRLLLIFQHNELVAIKHDRPVYVSGKKSIKCNFGLSLLIVADWDDKMKEQFIKFVADC